MDLSTFKNNISKGHYDNMKAALYSLRLIWKNCIAFYPVGDWQRTHAETMDCNCNHWILEKFPSNYLEWYMADTLAPLFTRPEQINNLAISTVVESIHIMNTRKKLSAGGGVEMVIDEIDQDNEIEEEEEDA